MRPDFSRSGAPLLALLLVTAGAGAAAAADRGPRTPSSSAIAAAERAPAGGDLERVRPVSRDGATGEYMIELDGPAAARAVVRARTQGAGRAAAASAGRAQRSDNGAQQRRVIRSARGARLIGREIFRVGTAFNGVAVTAKRSALARLAKLDGVKAVRPLDRHVRTNSLSVPFVGVPSAWSRPDTPLTGAGLKIGVVDTGVDATHKNFGGSGTPEDLAAARNADNNPASASSVPSGFKAMNGDTQLFPSAKVAGGYDFAGDTYTGTAASVRPDPNPQDCLASSAAVGHGSHVAGIAAGYGVDSGGATFAGPYDGSVPYSSLAIGPGAAPGAAIYALKVFGCSGSTSLTTQAIDWAVDPNGDGDTADRLDVLNLSLSSAYGSEDAATSAAANTAAAAGVVVVLSAGNEGDVTSVSGSPGAASRGITVANSNGGINASFASDPTQADLLWSTSSRGPGLSGDLKPDVAAPGVRIGSTASGTGAGGQRLTGTSMSTPLVAGSMALLRQQHPGWTVAELKALLMNNARHDLFTGAGRTGTKYGPQRVGAGRIDIEAATGGDVLAFDDGRPERVSVAFGALEVNGTKSVTRTVRVVNKGTEDRTYDVGYAAQSTIPGVSISFPDGASVSVPAGGSTTFRVALDATASDMRDTRDPTSVASVNNRPRHYLNEVSGRITLTPPAGTALRVPLHAAVQASTDMRAVAPTATYSGTGGTGTLGLEGSSLPSATGGFVPAVQAFALQGTSPRLDLAGTGERGRRADLRYVGIASEARRYASTPASLGQSLVFFGLATWDRWHRPSQDVDFEISIDKDRNGSTDYVVLATRFSGTDVFITAVYDPATQGVVGSTYLNGFTRAALNTAPFNSDVLVLPVGASQIGLGPGATRFNYTVDSYVDGDRVDGAGPFTYDLTQPGIDSTHSGFGTAYNDAPGNAIDYIADEADMAADGSTGLLLLHHLNQTGARAEAVPVVPATPVASGRPTIAGAPESGAVLTGTGVSWSNDPDTTEYYWRRCDAAGADCQAIPGARGTTYEATGEDAGHRLRFAVRAKRGRGDFGSAQSVPTLVVDAPVATAKPRIAVSGNTLTARPGTWEPAPTQPYGYRWLRCDAAGAGCAPVDGEEGPTYTANAGDAGHRMRVTVTAANAAGANPSTSGASPLLGPPSFTVAPRITGSAQPGGTLQASSGAWTPAATEPYAYQWQRCDAAGGACVPVGDGTASYPLGDEDLGKRMRVVVTATNAAGSRSATSAPSRAVGAPVASPGPILRGTAREGSTLTVTEGTWAPAATQPLTFTWQRCDQFGLMCKPVGAATPSYTLVAADVGHRLRAVVTATNDHGSGTAVSNRSPVVAAD